MTPKELCNKLAKYYWSPKHPSEYVLTVGGKNSGIGVIAHKSYGTFNLVYEAVGGELNTISHHAKAISLFTRLQDDMATVVEGAAIEDWATLYNKAEFLRWAQKDWSKIPKFMLLVMHSAYAEETR